MFGRRRDHWRPGIWCDLHRLLPSRMRHTAITLVLLCTPSPGVQHTPTAGAAAAAAGENNRLLCVCMFWPIHRAKVCWPNVVPNPVSLAAAAAALTGPAPQMARRPATHRTTTPRFGEGSESRLLLFVRHATRSQLPVEASYSLAKHTLLCSITREPEHRKRVQHAQQVPLLLLCSRTYMNSSSAGQN